MRSTNKGVCDNQAHDGLFIKRARSGEPDMYCLSCGASLPEDALFCLKCGQLTARGNGESGQSEHTPIVSSVSSPFDPYSPRPSTYYGPLPPEGGTQNP